MNKPLQIGRNARVFLAWFVFTALGSDLRAQLPCPEPQVFSTGLLGPSKIIQIPSGRFLVAEVGPADQANAARVSIIDRDGTPRTLVEGLPSARAFVGDPSGTSGLWLEGRALYIVNGQGDVTLSGPVQGTERGNPSPSSPLFSSVLVMEFSEAFETNPPAFKMSIEDHHRLKSGAPLELRNSSGAAATVRLAFDIPDYLPEARPNFAENVRHSHPYGIVGDPTHLYIIDGGFNNLRKVEIATGQETILASFPPTPNPLTNGPPVIENVPTSIHWVGGQLVVTILGGAPFLPGLSKVVAVHPRSGTVVSLIEGLTTAIDSAALSPDSLSGGVLALEYDLDFPRPGLGRLQSISHATGNSVLHSACLATPTSMLIDRATGRLFLTELASGRLITLPAPPSLPGGGYIYFSEFGGGTIGRVNLDGSGKVALVTGLSNPVGPTLDATHGQLLWGDAGAATMRRANLDATGVSTVVSNPNGGMPALDLAGGRMYWSVSTSGNIWAANLDASDQQLLVTGLSDPHTPVLDSASGHLYWPNFGSGEIERINLDGTERTTILQGLSGPSLLALDLAGRAIYWTCHGTQDIRRANLDGSDQQILIRGEDRPSGIALDLDRGHIYWASTGAGEIRRARLDGTDIQTLVKGLQGPSALTLDLAPLSKLRAGLEGRSVTWNAVLGRGYSVQYKTNLNQPSWTSLIDRITATNSSMNALDLSDAHQQRFYRVQLLAK